MSSEIGGHPGETLWCADWNTGETIWPFVETLRPLDNDQQIDGWPAAVETIEGWAREGSAPAAWWLAWWYVGVLHAKSMWYSVAAARLDINYCDYAQMQIQEGVLRDGCGETWPPPCWDIRFAREIPEVNGELVPSLWREAIDAAEQAVDAIATDEQIKEAMACMRWKPSTPFAIEVLKHSRKWRGDHMCGEPRAANPADAAYAAGITELGFKTHPRYLRWRRRYERRVEERDVAYRDGEAAGPTSNCPYPKRTALAKAWLNGQRQAFLTLKESGSS